MRHTKSDVVLTDHLGRCPDWVSSPVRCAYLVKGTFIVNRWKCGPKPSAEADFTSWSVQHRDS